MFVMTCSTVVQIYKNYGGQQVFVLRVQTELINSVYRDHTTKREYAARSRGAGIRGANGASSSQRLH
jgi:hypothetical protein